MVSKNSLKKTIYFTRHGQSEYNKTGQLGGDSPLSEDGIKYSKFLYSYFKLNNSEDINVITSGLVRTNMTAKLFRNKKVNNKFMEINAGIFEHYTYDEIKKENILEFNKRKIDKFNYRYPKGESYKDLEERIIPEFKKLLELQDNFLLVAHNAVLRVIFGYLYSMKESSIPFLEIPLHTIFKIEIYEDGSNMKTVISHQ
jgi:6-phosphofructo-2-kinase/fructose-2,6-biphosphatase 2